MALSIRPDALQGRGIDRQRFSGVKDLIPIANVICSTGDLLAIRDDKTTDGLLEVLRGITIQQGHGTLEALRCEQVVAVRRQRHEHGVLLIVAADYDLDARVDPVVTSHRQEPDIVWVDGLLVLEKIMQFCGKILVSKQAAACRRGVTADAIPFGELELDCARTPTDAEKLFSIDYAVQLGGCGGEQFGRERTEDQSPHVRITLDYMESIASLRHGPLAEHLAGDYEWGIHFLHQSLGLLQHEYFAVDARIRVLTVPVNGIADQVDIVLPHVDDAKVYADGFRDHRGMGLVLFPIALGKRRGIIEPHNIKALFHDDPGRQDAIETPRYKSKYFIVQILDTPRPALKSYYKSLIVALAIVNSVWNGLFNISGWVGISPGRTVHFLPSMIKKHPSDISLFAQSLEAGYNYAMQTGLQLASR